MPTRRDSSDHPPLRLCRDEPGDEGPVLYRFPRAQRDDGPRERLVGAKVSREPVERRFTGSSSPCAVVHDPDVEDDQCAGRIISSRDLVREIESTLDRMQDRLNKFRHQVDGAFQFPSPEDDGPFDPSDRPRAA